MERPGRHEFEKGQVVATAPEGMGHLRAKTASFDALAAAIDRARLRCQALPDGAAVRIDAATLCEPAALVF